jgi:hypothetical protein
VWGTADGDNIVWGTDDGANLTWATSADGSPVLAGSSNALTDEEVFALLGQAPIADTSMIMMMPDETVVVTVEPPIEIMLDPAILFMVDTTIPETPPDPAILEPEPTIVTSEPAATIVTTEPETTAVVIPLEGGL